MEEDRLPVGALRNLGPKSARVLAEVGIRTIAELRLIGPARANPAKVEDFGDEDLLKILTWRESLSAK